MNTKSLYLLSLTLTFLAFILLIADIAMINTNRHAQDELAQRQAEISKGTTLVNLNQNLIQALAEAAVTNNNSEIKGLLAAQGITLKPNAAAAKSSTPNKK